MALVDSDANLDSVAASLHDYGGVCDYCGKQCDPELQDLNLVCCSFAKCPTPMVFHQCCVDEYLKKRKLGKDAKIGFPCLRGYSNKSADYEKPCKGRVFRLHHVHARMENSKKRQKAKMPDNFVPGPAKREKKEKADEGQPDKAPAKPAKAVAPPAAKPLQPLVNIFAPANKQPAKKPAPPAVPKPPADMDQSKMDAIRKQVEAMRQKKGNPSAKLAADSFAKAKKPPSRQDQLMVQHALESAQAGHVAGIPSGWANGAPSEAPPAEEAEDSDEEGEWMTVLGRKKGKAAAKPPSGVSRKQAKKQAWHDKQAALKAAQAPDPTPAESATKAVPKPPAQAPPASPAPLFNAWGKPREEQPQAPPLPRSPSPPVARPASPPVWRPSPSPPPAVQGLRSWSEKLLTVLKEHKIRVATKQLLELGFPDWLSVTAVRACGTDVDRCCEWLNSGQSPADPIIDLTAELARISKWVSVGCLSQDVVEISLVSCSGDIDAAETVLRANFDHFAEHSSAAFAPDPSPGPAPTGPVQNSWSDDLFPLNWGTAGRDSVAPRPAPPPRKKEQPTPPLKDPPRPDSAPKPQTPVDPPRPESPPKPQTPAFEIPKTMLAGNGSYITDLSRYNELLGISDEDSEDEEFEEGEAGADPEVRDPASLLKEYLGGSDSSSNKAEVPAPATPPASEARSAQNGMSNGLDTDDLLAVYGIFPKAAVSTPRPYLPGLKYERQGPEEDQDTLVSQLMTQLLV